MGQLLLNNDERKEGRKEGRKEELYDVLDFLHTEVQLEVTWPMTTMKKNAALIGMAQLVEHHPTE